MRGNHAKEPKNVHDALVDAFGRQDFPKNSMIGRNTDRVLESRQVEGFFRGRKWQDIDTAMMVANYEGDPSACLSFMTDDAYRYYLPAYMRMTLEAMDRPNTIYCATIWGMELTDEKRARIFEGFPLDQKQSIASFLSVIDTVRKQDDPQDDDAENAFKSYWINYIA